MKTNYINKFVNEYGQVDTYCLLESIREKYKFKLYRVAERMLDELYEIYTGTEFENINNKLFVLTFDEECNMFLLIDRLSKKLHNA